MLKGLVRTAGRHVSSLIQLFEPKDRNSRGRYNTTGNLHQMKLDENSDNRSNQATDDNDSDSNSTKSAEDASPNVYQFGSDTGLQESFSFKQSFTNDEKQSFSNEKEIEHRQTKLKEPVPSKVVRKSYPSSSHKKMRRDYYFEKDSKRKRNMEDTDSETEEGPENYAETSDYFSGDRFSTQTENKTKSAPNLTGQMGPSTTSTTYNIGSAKYSNIGTGNTLIVKSTESHLSTSESCMKERVDAVLIQLVTKHVTGKDNLCNEPLIQSLPDDHLTATSSRRDPIAISSPERSRLNTTDIVLSNGTTLTGGWSPVSDSRNHYIQATFDHLTMINEILTQGRHQGNGRVTLYKVQYTIDGSNWEEIKDDSGVEKIFNGGSDSDTIQTNTLDCSIFAKGVRIIPMDWDTHVALRFDVTGCYVDTTMTVTTAPSFVTSVNSTSSQPSVSPYAGVTTTQITATTLPTTPTTATPTTTKITTKTTTVRTTSKPTQKTTATKPTTNKPTSKITTPLIRTTTPYLFLPGIPNPFATTAAQFHPGIANPFGPGQLIG